MSWHGPSAPRVEGMATKSAVVASCASKPASTASRIRCWVSVFTAFLVPSQAELAIDQSTSGPLLWRAGHLSESQKCPYNSSHQRRRCGEADGRQQERAL